MLMAMSRRRTLRPRTTPSPAVKVSKPRRKVLRSAEGAGEKLVSRMVRRRAAATQTMPAPPMK
jgi:hypothetical protein